MAQHKRHEAAALYAARAKPKQGRYFEETTGGLDKMIDYHSILVSALNTVLPTYYEMALHKGIETPCISYMELNNYVEEGGDTLGYSRLSYQVKVWGHDIKELQRYALAIDATLRPLGWKRISSGEIYDNNSTMIQKILTYEAKAKEVY